MDSDLEIWSPEPLVVRLGGREATIRPPTLGRLARFRAVDAVVAAVLDGNPVDALSARADELAEALAGVADDLTAAEVIDAGPDDALAAALRVTRYHQAFLQGPFLTKFRAGLESLIALSNGATSSPGSPVADTR